jgi:hypothetical protein
MGSEVGVVAPSEPLARARGDEKLDVRFELKEDMREF